MIKRFAAIWLGLALVFFLFSFFSSDELPNTFGEIYGILYIWLLWMFPVACLIELVINLVKKRKQK
ncbi:hypothetical protein CIG75_04265 [Tumebacillus algifaecis]|uniref:DUF3955 domain-containing protein n=1 Tax=Tumebacillus algifaecis TaxID=1214604 RepID=A0A223CYX5_9BACL|nr:hypothetical protein [Tumebacillus algifaecis]ASS74277.1 hypothetical protein CIG75_04265 [Tumebacillus algifaecis]